MLSACHEILYLADEHVSNSENGCWPILSRPVIPRAETGLGSCKSSHKKAKHVTTLEITVYRVVLHEPSLLSADVRTMYLSR